MVELRRAANRVKETSRSDLPLLSMSAARGVRLRDESDGRAASEDRSSYLAVKVGDIVVNKLSARDGAFGRSSLEGIVSPAYWVLSATPEFDSRYIDYFLHSSPAIGEIGRLSKFMPPAQYDIAWEDFGRMLVPELPLEEQRRIADFLDDQVARIDAAITARAAHARCGKELCDVMQEELLGSWGLDDMWSKSTVGRACKVAFGEAFASEDFTASGEFPVIRMGDIGKDGFQNFISKSLVPPGVVVRDDDVVVGMSGRFQVEVWTRGPAALNQRVAGLRWPHSGILLAAQVQGHLERFEQELGGTTLTNLSTGDLRGIPVLVPSSETVLRDAVGRLHTLAETRSSLVEISGKAVIALEEFKRSLVTAAVTGELDVTAARRGIRA